jgi:ABC-type antimicrobial peptide transport system permease subunit
MKTQRAQMNDTIGPRRAFAGLTTVSGLIGLVLACVGLYGVVSYDTAQRTQEIGLRMALGARRIDVVQMVLRQTVIVVSIAAAIGLPLAMVASRLIRGLLFGIARNDPLAIGAALAVLLGAALAASYRAPDVEARSDSGSPIRMRPG